MTQRESEIEDGSPQDLPREIPPHPPGTEPAPPERIFLQWENGTDFDWTWAAERINDEDTEYVLCRRSSPPTATSVEGMPAEMAKQAALGHKMFCVGAHEHEGGEYEYEWISWDEAFAKLATESK